MARWWSNDRTATAGITSEAQTADIPNVQTMVKEKSKEPVQGFAAVRNDEQPAWVTPELPDQYGEIARQIAALKEQARSYEGVASVLWQSGETLVAACRDLFIALDFETDLAGNDSNCDLMVRIGQGRRLLVDVVSETSTIDRKSAHIARILRVLQEDAGEQDRVVLAANVFPMQPLAERRQDAVSADALRLIQGMGANVVPTSALFGIWKSSIVDLAQARKSVMNLYAMDGGIFR